MQEEKMAKITTSTTADEATANTTESANGKDNEKPIPATVSADEDEDENTTPKKSTIFPTIPPPPLSDSSGRSRRINRSSPSAVIDHWNKASTVLRENPSLMTQRVLLLALQRQPPAHIIRFMISVNPKAASVIPKQGAMPLQVAVRHRASVEVIQALLEACPFALCVTNPETMQDPLAFAKRYRSNEPDLIELLSRPIGYWVSGSNSNRRDPDMSVKSFTEEARISPPLTLSTSSSSSSSDLLHDALRPTKVKTQTLARAQADLFRQIQSPLPVQTLTVQANKKKETKSKENKKPRSNSTNTSGTTMHTRPIDRQELNNVKLLCAQVLKNHRRLARKMESYEERLDAAKLDKEILLKSMETQQMQHFYRQLMALEMKERSMRAHMEDVHERCLVEYDHRVHDLSDGLDAWKLATEERLNQWRTILDHELRVNAHFRNDLTEWMEYQAHQTTVTPFVYATPLGELGEDTPLMRSDSNSTFAKHYIKKKAWTPFRHWEHIKLREEE